MKLFHCFLPALIGIFALILTAAAQPIRGTWDPVCGLPALDLTGNGNPGDYRLSGVDDLKAGNWESLLDLTLGSDPTRWHDMNGHAKGRRFYRLEKLDIRPPRIPVANFRLIDHLGVARELYREGDAAVIVLVFGDNAEIQAHWPAIKSSRRRINRMEPSSGSSIRAISETRSPLWRRPSPSRCRYFTTVARRSHEPSAAPTRLKLWPSTTAISPHFTREHWSIPMKRRQARFDGRISPMHWTAFLQASRP